MDTSEVYPDVLGGALSYSSQRLAQLGSLVTAAAVVEAQRRAQAHAARAARDEQALSALHDQDRAAWQLARAGVGAGTRFAVARPGRPAPGSPRLERRRGLRRCGPDCRICYAQVRGAATCAASLRHGVV
jgi:hypothetical protein